MSLLIIVVFTYKLIIVIGRKRKLSRFKDNPSRSNIGIRRRALIVNTILNEINTNRSPNYTRIGRNLRYNRLTI